MSPNISTYSYQPLPTQSSGSKFPRHDKTRIYQQIFTRKGKLSMASSLSQMFAKFSVLCLVEIKFNASSKHQPDPMLVTVYAIVTSLFIAHTVTLHLALCHIDTSLDPIIASSNNSIEQFDFNQLPFHALFFSWDFAYVVGICGGYFLFSLCFILLLWIKFAQFGRTIPLWGFIFMGPVLLIVVIYAIVLYLREKRQRMRGG